MKHVGKWVVFCFLLLFVLFFLIPFYLVVINSFKDYGEIVANVISFPSGLRLDNYKITFDKMAYPATFLNTLIVTGAGTFGIMALGSLAGYQIARNTSMLSKIIFFLLIIPMMIPFQSFMLSLVKISTDMGIIGSKWGLSVIYWACGTPMAVFLYRGYVMGVPQELDEAAAIDGCNPLQIYLRVIFPVLKPVNATVIVINAMWLWNDFLLPLLIIGGNKSDTTLQLKAYQFMGQYKMEWQYIMAAVILTLIPALVIYLIFQKQIVKGMVTGAVKG